MKLLVYLFLVTIATAIDSPVKKAILEELDLLLDAQGLEKLADYVKLRKRDSLAVQCLDNPDVKDSCPHWAASANGEGCTKFIGTMRKHCAKTCDLCRPPAPPIPELPPCAHTEFGCCWDNQTVAKGPTEDISASQCTPCLDKQTGRFCEYFKEDCHSPRIGQGDVMRRLCPTTCEVNCNINLNVHKCKDESIFCKDWAIEKKCGSDEEKMRVFCPSICGFC